MNSKDPTPEDINELTAFLPRLYREGAPAIQLTSGDPNDPTTPWPEYHPLVLEFFDLAAKECWRDYGYKPGEAADMIADENLIKNASIAQVKTMLTFCVRGERFCDGHWLVMLERGHIRRLLERLSNL